jgi:hypothetical protein
MKTTYLLAILILAVSCGPKNEEVTDEQIEIGSRTEVLDSIANTREDGVDVDVINDTVDTTTLQ